MDWPAVSGLNLLTILNVILGISGEVWEGAGGKKRLSN